MLSTLTIVAAIFISQFITFCFIDMELDKRVNELHNELYWKNVAELAEKISNKL